MDVAYSRDEKREAQLEMLVELIEKNDGLIKAADIDELGIDYRRVLRFVEDGYLIRVKNGYYTSKYFDCTEEQWILRLFPDGILTLESGLYLYGYLKERPYNWSIAVSKNISKSRFKIDYPVVTPFYTEDEVLKMGVTKRPFAGGEIGVYEKERLICDCLKYQEKMSRDDFKRGVLSYIQDDNKDVAKLMEYARERKVLKKVQSMIGVWL